jgi:hypothetical protein
MSHFEILGNTNDYVYGHDDARELASTTPLKAINNAENYEYFAENNPKLEMDVAEITNSILSLKTGWNLVGANSSLTLSELKTKIGAENLLIIQGQHKTYQKAYVDGGKDFLNSFTAFEAGRGYWVNVNSAVNVEYSKITYTTEETLSLIRGWSLVNPLINLDLEAIKTQLGTTLEVIQGSSEIYEKAKESSNNFENFEEPKGYWIKVSSDTTLTFSLEEKDVTAPTKATVVTTPITTTDTKKIELNGEVGATVFVNGVNMGTIGADGNLTIILDTSGADGIKSFSIVLNDASGNASEALVVNIERTTSVVTHTHQFNQT